MGEREGGGGRGMVREIVINNCSPFNLQCFPDLVVLLDMSAYVTLLIAEVRICDGDSC